MKSKGSGNQNIAKKLLGEAIDESKLIKKIK